MSDDNKPWNSRGDTDDTELRNGHSDAAADALALAADGYRGRTSSGDVLAFQL